VTGRVRLGVVTLEHEGFAETEKTVPLLFEAVRFIEVVVVVELRETYSLWKATN
jgi:hypothetical protein